MNTEVIPLHTEGREPPENRGRLMTAREVAQKVFEGKVSSRWVLDTVPNRVVLGPQKILWHELDVRAWLQSRREG